jgi:hypothetical protein
VKFIKWCFVAWFAFLTVLWLGGMIEGLTLAASFALWFLGGWTERAVRTYGASFHTLGPFVVAILIWLAFCHWRKW